MRRKTMSTFTLALVLGPAALSVAAQGEPAPTARVEVGQQAPAFSLPATDGATLTLDSLQGDKPLVLTFFRGTW